MRRRIVHQWRWSRCIYGDVNGDEEVDDEDDYNDDNVNAGDDDIDKNKENKNVFRVRTEQTHAHTKVQPLPMKCIYLQLSGQ